MRKILLIILIFTFFCVPAHAKDEVANNKSTTLLRDLGIINAKQATSTETVTRSEFATLVIQALGINPVLQESKFTDVPANHKDAAAIDTVAKLGIFNGTSENEFSPDLPINIKQAVAVCVRMINYDKNAIVSGGYPSGYLLVASQKQLLKNVNVGDESNATRSDIYNLLYNTVTADMQIASDFTDADSINYNVYKGRNILTEYLKIFKDEGIVTSDYTVAIKGEPTNSSDKIVINNTVFLTSISQTQNIVGKNVEYYYRENNTDNTYTILAKYEKNNVSVVLNVNEDLKFDYLKGEYSVIDRDKLIRFSLGTRYSFVYNGELIDGSSESLMNPKIGNVTLIDNNQDSIYEVVFVDEYYNLIVGSYDQYTNKIYDKKSNDPVLDNRFSRDINLDEYKKIKTDIILSKLKQNTILTVFKNPTQNTIKIQSCTDTVVGNITEITSDQKTISVDNVTYKFTGDLRFNIETLKVGSKYTFYLNSFGDIAALKLEANQMGGYVIDVKLKAGIENVTQMKILTTAGDMEVLSFASRVNVMNGVGNTSDVKASYMVGQFSKYINNRVFVLYSLNDNKEVNRLVFPQIVTDRVGFENMDSYPLYKLDYLFDNWPGVSAGVPVTRAITRGIWGVDNWLVMGEDALVMEVPPTEQTTYNETFINVTGISSYYDGYNLTIAKPSNAIRKAGQFDVYSIGGNSMRSNLMVHFVNPNSMTIPDEGVLMALVTDVKMVYDDKIGQTTYVLSVLEDGKPKELVMDDPNIILQQKLKNQYFGISLPIKFNANKTMVEKGDLIKYNIGGNGKVNALALAYDMANDTLPYDKEALGSLYRVVKATITRSEQNFIEYDTLHNTFERTFLNIAKIYIYNTNTNKATVGTINDIVKRDKVVIYSRYLLNRVVVIYKED